MNIAHIFILAIVAYVLSFVGMIWAIIQICNTLGFSGLILPLIVLIICMLVLARTKITFTKVQQ